MSATKERVASVELAHRLRQVARWQAAVEESLRAVLGFVPGGAERVAKFNERIERANNPPPFGIGDRVRHTERLIEGKVLTWDEIRDIGRIEFDGGQEKVCSAYVLEKV